MPPLNNTSFCTKLYWSLGISILFSLRLLMIVFVTQLYVYIIPLILNDISATSVGEPLNIQTESELSKSALTLSSGTMLKNLGLLTIAPQLTNFPPSGSNMYSSEVINTLTTAQQLQMVAVASIQNQHPFTPPTTTSDIRIEKKNVYCYLCNFICAPKSYVLLSQYSDTESPFFPFLTICKPAPLADDMSESGHVTTCRFCYFNLMCQWIEYEEKISSVDRQALTELDYKARCYMVGRYCCFVCSTNEMSRSELGTLSMEMFPFLRTHHFMVGACLLDRGESVLVCGMCHASLTSQYDVYETRSVPTHLRKYHWINDKHRKQHFSSKMVSSPCSLYPLFKEYV